jgi:hypothetical protein
LHLPYLEFYYKEKKEWIVQLDEIKDLLLKDTHQFHPFLKDELSRVIEKSEQADYNVEDAAIPECSKLPSHNPPSDSATGYVIVEIKPVK